MTGEIILVVAGNHQQYKYWHHQAGRPENWRYVWDVYRTRGCSPYTPVFLVGQWWLTDIDVDYIRAIFFNITEWSSMPVAPFGAPPTIAGASVIPLMHRSLVGGFKIKRRVR